MLDVHKHSLLSLFEPKHRLEVPLFQRQYVWSEEHQWVPLWEDIERKFADALEARKDGPLHFLGAMVMAQKQTPFGHVVVRQVIDGQQRLTTLQIFLAAFRDFSRSKECVALAGECEKYLLNSGMMADKDVDRFKVWPTQLDQPQFRDVVTAGSYDELLKRYPVVKQPYKRKPDPRPRMVEAYFFFHAKLETFFVGEADSLIVAGEVPIADRLDECFQALKTSLMVVVMDLQVDDDPQVIFETLNARGEPLLPADLLRNYIFLRASREGLNVEDAYRQHWARFDDEFWREEDRQGRLIRPRSDLFLQHFLSSRQGRDIPIKHLYVEYRHWLEKSKPFPTVLSELEGLARQRDDYRRIIAPEAGDALAAFSAFLQTFEISTAYPFLLVLLDRGASDDELVATGQILESYFLRRAICGEGTANYNRIMLNLAKLARDTTFTPETLRQHLLALGGASGIWPDDNAFRSAWMNQPLYRMMSSARLVHVFTRLTQTFMSSKAEALTFERPPTIEHIMPQSWRENWPLADGSMEPAPRDLPALAVDDPSRTAAEQRDRLVQTAGNLTLLTSGMNTAQSNHGWERKRSEMMIHSLLPLNQLLANVAVWNEQAIAARGKELLTRALLIWPR